MKVLVIFIDMVRTDLMFLYNKKARLTPFDILIEQMGGTLFTNCYTPAPDTPRSLACMQTGLFPAMNGCDSRIKWPQFYIDKSIDTMWDLLIRNNIEINYFNQKSSYETGPISRKDKTKIRVYHLLDDFKKNILSGSAEDELDYLTLNDYHWCIDDYGGTINATIKAKCILAEILKQYFVQHDISKYDHIFIHSDHGHLLDKEIAIQKSDLEYLNDSRSKILMFHHQKNDQKGRVSYNSNLHSVQDIFATMMEVFHIDTDKRNSCSLLSTQGHDFIVIEDHNNFIVTLNQRILLWRYISRDGASLYTNIYNTSILGDVDRESAVKYIKKYSPSYIDCEKQIEILNKYKRLKSEQICYNNGSKRPSYGWKFATKVKNRIKRRILEWIY